MIYSIRKPSACGRFYPENETALKELITKMLNVQKPYSQSLGAKEILGGIVPHAGYVFSGRTAILFFESLAKQNQAFDTAIILSPNHTGWGPGIAFDSHQAWETPLGVTAIDLELQTLIPVEFSSDAHHSEHSAEVILPMLQFFFANTFKIMPICLWDQSPVKARWLAIQLLAAIKKLERKVIVIASTDFSHYETPEYGFEQDEKAINQLMQFDIMGFYNEIKLHNISICGYGPVMTLMALAKLLYKEPVFEVLHRSHSGKTLYSQEVVNYMSGIVFNAGK